MAIVRNLATVKTTADITSSATSIPVNRVDVFGASQTTLDKPFYVTIMPASGDEPANSTNSEIVLVTGISGTNLTVTRGQRSTTAKAFNSGAIVTMAIYAEDAVLLGDEGTAVENPAPWIDTSDIKNGAITTDKIPNGAVSNTKIDWSSTSRPIYYRGTNWARSWTFKYDSFSPQLIFIAWENSTAMFARIWDTIYKVFQNGGRTVTSSIDKTNHTWTLSTDNTGVVNVLELRNTKTGE